LTLLYLLSSGQLWEGGHDTVPVDANDVAIVSALKSADEAARTGSQCVGQPWEILVPTAMQIIDGAPLEAIL
jgi:hypothetical protein